MTTDIIRALRTLGGVATRAELLQRGIPPAAIRTAWRRATVIRIRHGTYGLPTLPPAVVRAARVGGSLAAHSATGPNHLWVPPGDVLHVSVPPHASGLRDPDDAGKPLSASRNDVVAHFDAHQIDRRVDHPIVGVRRCVLQVMLDPDPRVALAVLDSAIRRYGLSNDDVQGLAAELPRRCHRILERVDGAAEAGSESAMRWGLHDLGLRFEAQVEITSTIRVDFRVDGWLVIECVSHAHHSSPSQYENDRGRISAIVHKGNVVLEFTHHQIFSRWGEVERTIMAAYLRG